MRDNVSANFGVTVNMVVLVCIVLYLRGFTHMVHVWMAGKNCVIPLLHVGRVWLLVAVLRGSLSVVIAALRARCISCILRKVERICLNYIKGKDYYYYYYYYYYYVSCACLIF